MTLLEALLQHLQNQGATPEAAPQAQPPVDPAFLNQAITPPEPAQAPMDPHPLVQALTSGGGMLDFIKRKAGARQAAIQQAADY